jgi:hypothetical protein
MKIEVRKRQDFCNNGALAQSPLSLSAIVQEKATKSKRSTHQASSVQDSHPRDVTEGEHA